MTENDQIDVDVRAKSRLLHEQATAYILKVINGEFVPCPYCGARTVYYGLGEGVHPGIHCVNGHELVLMEMEPKESG